VSSFACATAVEPLGDGAPLDEPALAMLSDAWWPSPLPRLTRPAALPTKLALLVEGGG